MKVPTVGLGLLKCYLSISFLLFPCIHVLFVGTLLKVTLKKIKLSGIMAF